MYRLRVKGRGTIYEDVGPGFQIFSVQKKVLAPSFSFKKKVPALSFSHWKKVLALSFFSLKKVLARSFFKWKKVSAPPPLQKSFLEDKSLSWNSWQTCILYYTIYHDLLWFTEVLGGIACHRRQPIIIYVNWLDPSLVRNLKKHST